MWSGKRNSTCLFHKISVIEREGGTSDRHIQSGGVIPAGNSAHSSGEASERFVCFMVTIDFEKPSGKD
jgi:hypothetical protein